MFESEFPGGWRCILILPCVNVLLGVIRCMSEFRDIHGRVQGESCCHAILALKNQDWTCCVLQLEASRHSRLPVHSLEADYRYIARRQTTLHR